MNQIDFYDSICLKLISLGGKSEYSNPYKMTKVWLEKYNIQYDKLILTNTFDLEILNTLKNNYNLSISISDKFYV